MSENNLLELIEACKSLKDQIKNASIPGANFDQQYGWNQVALGKTEVEYLITNLITRLENYGEAELTENFSHALPRHIDNIKRLESTSRSYFNNNAGHLVSFVPVLINTILVTIDDVVSELYSWENLNDSDLLPSKIKRKLTNYANLFDKFDANVKDLDKKIEIINSAHSTAENLPTVIEELIEARKTIDTEIKKAKETNREIMECSVEINGILSKLKELSLEADSELSKTSGYANASKELADQCKDYLNVTTTHGLASGFDQKAKELKKSINLWLCSLLAALTIGGFIGFDRVSDMQNLLMPSTTPGQYFVQILVSIFSIGGPLWLAWISTQQINQRFKLSEDYSYKATVAKSFVGFQEIAVRFGDGSEQRLFKSTLDRLDEMPLRLVEGKDYNSPWHELLDSDAFKQALHMVPSLAKEVGRFSQRTKLRTSGKPENKVRKPSLVNSEKTESNDSDSNTHVS
ncbi:hypothetical protein ATN88_05900 [Enterovibrio coralii]|uniref:Uncharacterized protein n=2 Tax=Enterovibrio coralii TaxID=294935 RepID=A0A135ICN5_9GAMM|nr:hypothetical protein ATN88_05900 [Enterovibrio coralii]